MTQAKAADQITLPAVSCADSTEGPALFVQMVTSLPLLLVATVLPLRPFKGWLVASQFFFKAQEGLLAAD